MMSAFKRTYPELYRYYDKLLLWLMLSFFATHMLNHLMIYAGAETHIWFMESLRVIYRFAVIEVLLIWALYRQVAAGFVQLKRFKKNAKGRFGVLVWSGIYLIGFLVIHLSAVMAGRFALQVDTNLYFGVAGYRGLPEALFFVPYYFFAIWAAFAHGGAVIWLRSRAKRPTFAEMAFLIGVWGGLLLAVISTLGLSGILVDFQIPNVYLF